ncbi:MAG: PilW family protein [Vibrio sp.]|uniref:PilW family protein n=1 Tax=Vibrio sp. TaxID=678 RepID=UPI003A83B8AD
MQTRGFTLVEMVLTMVIGSILILGIAGFVQLGSKGYADTVARQTLQTQAKFVLEKMTREIRHAVPNSFYAGNDCLSFYPIDYSGFYHVADNDNTQLSFIVGQSSVDPTSSPALTGKKMIINPTHYSEFSSGIDLNSNSTTITIAPLASQSVAKRFYIYQQQVTYCLDSATKQINRNGVQVADHLDVSKSEFRYADPTLQRGGVIHIALTFEQNGESSSFETDVQVLNVP